MEHQAEQATYLSSSERLVIETAGAQVLAEHLRLAIVANHRRTGGMANSVGVESAGIDGVKVGFDAQHGYIARFLNDGTKHILADHFVDEVRETAKPAIFQAELAAYRGLHHIQED